MFREARRHLVGRGPSADRSLQLWTCRRTGHRCRRDSVVARARHIAPVFPPAPLITCGHKALQTAGSQTLEYQPVAPSSGLSSKTALHTRCARFRLTLRRRTGLRNLLGTLHRFLRLVGRRGQLRLRFERTAAEVCVMPERRTAGIVSSIESAACAVSLRSRRFDGCCCSLLRLAPGAFCRESFSACCT